MINIKHVFIYIIRIGVAVAPLLIVWAILDFFFFDDTSWCLDHKMIYDPIQKICRDDCLTWDDEVGCVPVETE